MGDFETEKNDLQRKIEEVLYKKAPDKDKLNTNTFEDILEEIQVYHQELEYQNQELMRIRDDLEISRHHFQTLFDEAPIGYVLVNKDFRIIRTNKFFPELMGVDLVEFNDLPLHEIIDPESQDDFYFMKRRIQQQKQIIHQQLRLSYKNKQPVIVKAFSRNVNFKEGNHYLFTFSDISNELEALEKAKENDRLKTAFLNNLSHEIKTPLNCIIGFSTLLNSNENTAGEMEMYANNVVECSQKLNQIIEDIIQMSSIETGQEAVHMVKEDLEDLFAELLVQYSKKAESKNIKLSFTNYLKAGQSKIIIDADKLKLILQKLIDNAIKYTNTGSVEFTCRLKNGQLLFGVSDSGIGIEKVHHEIIFDRFRQVDDGNSRRSEGNGLGLAIAKSFVQLLGGKIWVESKPGDGSTFYFTIPHQV